MLARSTALSCVPERKLLDALNSTLKACPECSGKAAINSNLCNSCRIKNKAIQRYAEANIPALYWALEMELHFTGNSILKEKYLEITKDLNKQYKEGLGICFAGSLGTGKTFTATNILKRAVEKNFSGLYCNLNDVISVIVGSSEDKSVARKELLMVDFLVIDEFDPRYIQNDKAADLFGKILEEIFRTRHQNTMPTIMCTNSPNVVKKSFDGAIKDSLESLMSTVEMIPVVGKDHRKDPS